MPAAVIVPAIIGAATSVGTTAYGAHQSSKAAGEARRRELQAAAFERRQTDRAFKLAEEQQDYDRWLRSETSRVRQPYLDAASRAGGGSTFDPGAYTPAAPFVAPTREAATRDPGYQATVGEGQRALDESSTARSALGEGGTEEAVAALGQQAATGQYDKVRNRAINAYSLAEMLRGNQWDRSADAGFKAAALANAAGEARSRNYLSLAQLTGPGRYPGFSAPGMPPGMAVPRPLPPGQRRYDWSAV